MFGPQEEAGRSGLSQIEVTHWMYIQLQHALDTGQKITHKKKPLLYNETQLKMAYGHYLRENSSGRAPWTAHDVQDMDKFYDLATKIVAKDIDAVKKENEKNQKKDLAPSVANKKLYAFLAEHDLLPDPKDEIEFEDLPSQTKAEQVLRTALTAENAIEALALAGEPTATVAMGFMIIAAESAVTDKVLEFLLEKTYEYKAHNIQEKNPIINMMHDHAPENFLLQKREKIDRLHSREKDPEARETLHELKPTHDHKAESETFSQFRDNETMTQIPVFTKPSTTAKTRTPFDLPMAPDGPKIDFTDPAFGGQGKKRDEAEH